MEQSLNVLHLIQGGSNCGLLKIELYDNYANSHTVLHYPCEPAYGHLPKNTTKAELKRACDWTQYPSANFKHMLELKETDYSAYDKVVVYCEKGEIQAELFLMIACMLVPVDFYLVEYDAVAHEPHVGNSWSRADLPLIGDEAKQTYLAKYRELVAHDTGLREKNEQGEITNVPAENYDFYKDSPEAQIWWVDNSGTKGEHLFSFDKKRVFNLFQDYPHALTPEQRAIFDKECPHWADFFKDRT